MANNFASSSSLPRPFCSVKHRRVRADQRREEFRKLIVGGGFKGDEDEVADSNFLRRARAFGASIEVAFRAVDENALAFDGVVIRAQQEMDFLVGAGEFRAVVASDCACADDGDLHGEWGVGFGLSDEWSCHRALIRQYPTNEQ